MPCVFYVYSYKKCENDYNEKKNPDGDISFLLFSFLSSHAQKNLNNLWTFLKTWNSMFVKLILTFNRNK